MAQEPEDPRQSRNGPAKLGLRPLRFAAQASPDDAAILSEIGGGNLEHFDAFVDRYKGKLLGYIYQRINDFHRAEDISQDVFLRAFRAAADGQYDGRASAAPWLFTIARNCVADYLRAQAREPVPSQSTDVGEAVAAPASQGPERERGWQASTLLDRLPEVQREVAALKVFGGLTFSEIAKTLGCPLATAKSRMRYALLKIRELLPLSPEGRSSSGVPRQEGNTHHEPRERERR